MRKERFDMKEYVMNTYGRFDITFQKGKGCRLYDDKGKEYLDFVAGIAVNALGHSHPIMVEAIKSQAENLLHVSNLYWNEPQLKLSKLLVELSGLNSVFLCNSGTEAVEGALKIARKYGKQFSEDKNRVVYLEESFHGRSMGALSVTGQPKYQEPFNPLIGGTESCPANDVDALKEIMDDNVCAIILEPIQGEGGINVLPDSYLKAVKDLCNKHNGLLIFDEVQCGIGRTGNMFAFQGTSVEPDVVCLAKGLGGGVPIGAFIANEKADVLLPGDHGCTYGGNLLVSAVSEAVINEISKQEFLDHVQKMGLYLKEKLHGLSGKFTSIEEVKGTGLIQGIKLSIPTKPVVAKALEKKLLLVGAGKDVIRFVPPLIVSMEEIDGMIRILEDVFKEFDEA